MPHDENGRPITLKPAALHSGRADIGWSSSRCLQAPPHPLSCSQCLDACPVDALEFYDADQGVSLLASDACHGCGQCVPACPTEALISSEVDALMVDPPLTPSVRLGCHRVESQPNLSRLHCLRALGPDQLAWLAARAAPETPELCLPNHCQGCDAGPHSANEGADEWLNRASRLCTVTSVTAKEAYRAARQTLSRRNILRGQTLPRLTPIPANDAGPKARRLQRELAAAQMLGDTSAAPALPGLSLDHDACQAHSVCASVCPTSALKETSAGELIFDPQACLDCGHCVAACPEQALEAYPAPDAARVSLRATRRIDCFVCGRPFSPTETNHQTCPACRRETMLMQESFDGLFS